MYVVPIEQRTEFIEEIYPMVQKAYRTLGKVKPSVCIGMACVESNYGWGSNGKRFMYNKKAVLGQKVGSGKTATKYWSGKFFVASTQEEYQVGVHIVIKDAFREYDSLQQCFYNYYELLNTKLYKRVKANADYQTQMMQIKQCGYMTSSTEVDTVLSIINSFKLTRYDDEPVDLDALINKKKTVEDVAKEVIAGKWGNGTIRKAKLVLAGYDYKEVQTMVNKILKG